MSKSVRTEAPAKVCDHMAQMIIDLNYERDQKTGQLKVKTCLTPRQRMTERALRDTCGLTAPVSAMECRGCGGTQFGPAPSTIIELHACHYRCTRCKMITRQCGATTCGNCSATNLTLLPPAVNPDVYGFKVVAQ